MKALKELLKDSLTYGLTDALSRIISFLLIPLYTSYLTPSDYGIISLVAYVYTFFLVIASFGTTNAIFRRYNIHQHHNEQTETLSTSSLFLLITSSFLLVIAKTFSEEISRSILGTTDYEELINIAILGAFFNCLGNVFQVILRAQRKVKKIAVISLLKLVLTISTTIYLVVVVEMGVKGVILANAAGAILTSVLLFLMSRRALSFSFKLQELKALLLYGIPFIPHKIISQVSLFLPAFLLRNYIGLDAAGLYDISLKFALPLGFIVSSIQKSWVPMKFQIHREEDLEKRKSTFSNLISAYFIGVGFVCCAYSLVGPEILRLMTSSAEYKEAALYLPFVLLITFATGFYFMMGTGFENTDNPKELPIASMLALVLIFGIGFSFTPIIGILAVIFAVFIAFLSQGLLMRYFSIKKFHIPLNTRLIFLITFSAVLFSTISHFIQRQSFSYRWNFILVIYLFLFIIIVVILRNKRTLILKKYGHLFKRMSFLRFLFKSSN